MKVALICRSFDKNSGQGIYKMAGYLYEKLKKYSSYEIIKIEGKNKNPYYFDLIECSKRILNTNFDVYHFLMPEVCLPILLSRKIREKSIVTIHDAIVYKIKERRWLSEKYIKFMYKIASKAKIIHTPSQQTKNELKKLLKILANKINVNPWGVDLNFFRPLKKDRKRVLIAGYLGGLGKRKNIEWIIKTAKYFEDSIVFKIAGKGPKLKELEMLTKRMNLKNVFFTGFIPESELPQFYNSLDIFIFPSLHEGFGIPLLEAMACEVPYIIGANTGIVELLPIYKIKSFEELKILLEKIKNNELEPLKNTRKWIIKNKLTWKEYIKKLVKIYKYV